MLHDVPIVVQKAPHLIVVGNEKGGSGKTTIAMHVAVALLKEGQRVGTIDLDSNQKSFTHYIRKSVHLGKASGNRTRNTDPSPHPEGRGRQAGRERGPRIGGI